MRWSLPFSSTILVLVVAELTHGLAIPTAREYSSLFPRIKGAVGLNDIKSETYRETAKMSSVQINPDGTKTRLATAEERKAHGEAKFKDGDSEADHGLEKQQIPVFLKKNGLPTFDKLNKDTRARVNKVMNDVKNFAWIPSGMNSSKKHVIGQAIVGNKVSTTSTDRSNYLKAIYNRVKRTSQAVQKAVRKDAKYAATMDKSKGGAVDFATIVRQHYETAGLLKKGEKSPASTPGHTPFSSPGGSPVSGPSSPVAGSSKLPPASPGGGAPQTPVGSSTHLGKHGRSTSEASAGGDKATKKAKEGTPPKSNPGSPSNKFAGLPKLNTNISKSSPASPSSPRSALRKATPQSPTKDKGKSVQRSPKTSSPKTPGSRSPAKKSPTSPKHRGSPPRSSLRSPMRGLSPKPKPKAGATYRAKVVTRPAAKGGKGRK